MKIFSPTRMHEFDQTAEIEYSISSAALMENAALRVVEFLESKFAPLNGQHIAILCGKGNNGGDGFAIARHLLGAGCHVQILIASPPNALQKGAIQQFATLQTEFSAERKNAEIAPKLQFLEANAAGYFDFDANDDALNSVDIFLDAYLGTGFKGELDERGSAVLDVLRRARALNRLIIAVDIPSALDGETGAASPATVAADFTVTFAAPKRGMLLRDGIEKCGEIWVGEIGTTPSQMRRSTTDCEVMRREFAHDLLPQRAVDAHKGNAGKVVVCGGSRGMSGAPALAARAALRVGAGLCIAALPDRVLDVFAAQILEATSHALPCDAEGCFVESAADSLPAIWRGVDAGALGPGLSRSDGALNFARRVVRECEAPLLIDADALYALRAIESEVRARQAATILTPHPGEMGELMQISAKNVNENRLEIAVACAQKFNAFVVLKGARSVVAAPNGRTWFNLSGNAGMATGGSGDALTGTIVGLLAQTKDALHATQLGVYLHGLAGDIAYSMRGNGLIAHDIVEALPCALLDLQRRRASQSINSRLQKIE